MTNVMNRLAACEMEVVKPGRMIVRGLDGKPLRAADGSMTFIDIYSSDSEAARKHHRAVADDRIAARGRATLMAADMDNDAVDTLVALTAGWGERRPKPDKEGEFDDELATDFSAAAARKLYADPAYADIARQVNEFAGSRVNFAKASPSS